MPPRKRAARGSAAEARRYEDELASLSPDEIRKELQDLGESPGPIDSSNKEIYVRMLARKKLKLDTDTSEDTPTVHPSSSRTPIALARTPSKSTPTLSHTPSAKSAGIPSYLRDHRAAASPLVKSNTPRTSLQSASKMAATPQHIAKFEVKGLVAAPYTPFTDTGEVNLPVIKHYVNHLTRAGVHNVFVNGTTGESLSLTVEERKVLVQEWIKAATGRLTVIVHVGCENLKNTCELAQHAQESGAAAIGLMPTTFFKPATIEHLILYMEKVVEAAPCLPLFYYHIPSMTGVTFSMEEFLDAASSRLPTLRGLKFTSPNLFEFGRCVVNSGGKFQIMYGADEQLIGALALGCTAAVGSTYNYAGRLNNRLLCAFQRSDMEGAKLEQRRSQALIKLLHKYGSHGGAGRVFMRLQGLDLGPPRLPALPLSPEGAKNLESDLRDIGFFEWA